MKRITGALIAAVALTMSVSSGASAAAAGPRTPAGVGPSGVVPAASAHAEVARDVPDIEWPPAGVEPPGHARETLLEYAYVMTKHLDSAFPAAVPDADALWWVDWGGELPGVVEDGQDYLTTWAVYEDEIGRTGTNFQIEAPGHFTASPREFCEANAADCKAEFLADGSLLLRAVTVVQGNREYHIGSVLHYRTDGSVVWVSAYDYDPIWDGNEGPDRDEIALTFDQLTALATDPELHL